MEPFRWLTDDARTYLSRDYLLPGETPEAQVMHKALVAEDTLKFKGFAAKFYGYMAAGYYSLSTPVWMNYGNDRGMPISCYGATCPDSAEGLAATYAETFMQTKHGGGTAVYMGDIRGRGEDIKDGRNGKTSGSVHFARMWDQQIDIVSQGSARRGNTDLYWPITHPDIEEVLTIRTEGSPLQLVSFAVCVPNDWMLSMRDGDPDKRRLWAKIIERRCNGGRPFLFFDDNANDFAPDVYRDKGMRIRHSNLCTEVFLPTDKTESFVCCLSSMNVLRYDEWKRTDAVKVMVYFLDAVMSEFIEKAGKVRFMERAVKFAQRHRALGLGQFGWHSYLQSKGVVFGSMESHALNTEIARHIHSESYRASQDLAFLLGEPELMLGYGRRNSTLLAIAPTKSSAFIGGASESIQPYLDNYYSEDLQKGKFVFQNPYLREVLKTHNRDDESTWDDILDHGGSVQHLNFLTQRERDVFRTFAEINQFDVVALAAARQKYVDQGQSINLMFPKSASAKHINAVTMEAWASGLKSLYYQLSTNAAQEYAREIQNSCSACEG